MRRDEANVIAYALDWCIFRLSMSDEYRYQQWLSLKGAYAQLRSMKKARSKDLHPFEIEVLRCVKALLPGYSARTFDDLHSACVTLKKWAEGSAVR